MNFGEINAIISSPEQHVSFFEDNRFAQRIGLYKSFLHPELRSFLRHRVALILNTCEILSQVHRLLVQLQMLLFVQDEHVQGRKLALALTALKDILLVLVDYYDTRNFELRKSVAD